MYCNRIFIFIDNLHIIGYIPFFFISVYGSLCFLRADLYRPKPPVSRPVEGQEGKVIGGSAEHTLAVTVFRPSLIGNPVSILLSAQKRFGLLNAFGIRHRIHFRHFYDPVSLKIFINFLIIQPLHIISEPFIFYRQIFEESRFSGSLTAHKTEHDIVFLPRFIQAADGRQHVHLHNLPGIFRILGPEEMSQHPGNPRPAVPLQAFQQVNDWMETVVVRYNIYRLGDHPVAGKPVILFQIQRQIVHIRIRHLDAPSFPWHLFLNVDLGGHLIPAYSSPQAGIMFQNVLAVLDRLANPAFLRHFQIVPDLFRCQHFLLYNML